VALALDLAEPHSAPRGLLNEGSPADAPATRHHRRTTTRGTTAFPFRDAPTMPLLPFMHNVRAKRATTAGRQARPQENVHRTLWPGLVACRWRSA
jgi:hypothetical protein